MSPKSQSDLMTEAERIARKHDIARIVEMRRAGEEAAAAEVKAKAEAAADAAHVQAVAKTEATLSGRSNKTMNLAQRIAIAATAVAVALVLFFGQPTYSYRVPVNGDAPGAYYDSYLGQYFRYDDDSREAIARLISNVVGVAMLGGAVTLLLGIKRKRPGAGE